MTRNDKVEKTKAAGDWLTGRDARDRFKPLTKETVQAHTDAGSFSNGRQYYQNGYIVDAVLRGDTLRAKSLGQSGGPYTIQVKLTPVEGAGKDDPLSGWECSCPRGGFCKHVVAALLLWIERPEAVEVRGDIATLLRDRSREELLALVLDLLRRQPDLERWVETVLETSPKAEAAGAAGKLTLNPTAIKRQVVAAFAGQSYEWGEAAAVAGELKELVQVGDRYADAGQWANAQVVYAAVAEQAIAQYESLDDEGGDVDLVIGDCAQGLWRCLDVQSELEPTDRLSPEARVDLFRSLYDIWDHDRDYGGWDQEESVPELIRRTATPGERVQVEEWLRADLAQGAESDSYYAYSKRALIHFLVELKGADGITDEDILEEYRKAGLFEDVIDKLIEMGRVEDAIQVAGSKLKGSMETTRFAEKLLRLGKEWQERAIAYVEERLGEEEWTAPSRVPPPGKPRADPDRFDRERNIEHYLRWLEERYVQYDMPAKALAIAQRRFQAAPNSSTYDSVKRAAQMRGQPVNLWGELRPGLIATLESKADWGSLVTMYLGEGAVGDALAALDALEKLHPRPATTHWYGYVDSRFANYELPVAQAAEKDYPGEASAIYRRLAERHIEARDRANYAQAADYLARVKELYARQGRQEEWSAYIADLRTRNKMLRALTPELDARGLV